MWRRLVCAGRPRRCACRRSRDAKLGIDESRDVLFAAPIADGPLRSIGSRRSELDVAAGDLRASRPRGRELRGCPAGGAAAEELRRLAEVVLAVAVADPDASSCFGTRETKLTSEAGEDGARLQARVQDARRARATRRWTPSGRNSPRSATALAERVRKARGSAVEREQQQASRHEDADDAVVRGRGDRRVVRPEDVQHRHARARDDGGTRRRPQHEGSGGRASARARTSPRSGSSCQELDDDRSARRRRRSPHATTAPVEVGAGAARAEARAGRGAFRGAGMGSAVSVDVDSLGLSSGRVALARLVCGCGVVFARSCSRRQCVPRRPSCRRMLCARAALPSRSFIRPPAELVLPKQARLREVRGDRRFRAR